MKHHACVLTEGPWARRPVFLASLSCQAKQAVRICSVRRQRRAVINVEHVNVGLECNYSPGLPRKSGHVIAQM